MVVEGLCTHCNHKVTLDIDTESGVERRYKLLTETICKHCKWPLKAALQDDYGRFWGRRKQFNG